VQQVEYTEDLFPVSVAEILRNDVRCLLAGC